MILRSIAKSIRKQDWSVVFVELMVVVFGLVLAFQVDRWWEERADQVREREYIDRLISELEEDIEWITSGVELAELREDFCRFLLEVAENPAVAEQQPAMFLVAVAQAAYSYMPDVSGFVFEDLNSTGNVRLIRDVEIRNKLYRFYSSHDNLTQYAQITQSIELRYFELSAGVLDDTQLGWVQEHWYIAGRSDLEAIRVAMPDIPGTPAAIDRFIANSGLLAWLPRVRATKHEELQADQWLLSEAEGLVASLREYSAQLSQ